MPGWVTTLPTRTISFVWDGLGRRRTISYASGPTVQYRYDKLGTLRRLKSTLSNGLGTNNLDFTAIVDQVDATGRLRWQPSRPRR